LRQEIGVTAKHFQNVEVMKLHIGGAGVGRFAHTTPAITTNQLRNNCKNE
jgi:hypothetical protein